MKKYCFLLVLSLFSYKEIFATHITGGEMFYEYISVGSSPNTVKYRITLRLFRDENAVGGAPMPDHVWITLFNNDNLQAYPTGTPYFEVQRNSLGFVPVAPFPPCMINPPVLNYTVGAFSFVIDLPLN